jgi:hypothetical protein
MLNFTECEFISMKVSPAAGIPLVQGVYAKEILINFSIIIFNF